MTGPNGRTRRAGARRAPTGRLAALALAGTLVLSGIPSGPARAQEVRVTFAHPRAYADAGNRRGPDQPLRGTLRELDRILVFLGGLYLKPGERLDLTVLDLNIAGLDPLGYGVAGGPRIVNGATPPRIRLGYVLYRGGRAVARGVDDVTDPNFLMTQNPKFSSGGLYYERRILTDWFEARFRDRR